MCTKAWHEMVLQCFFAPQPLHLMLFGYTILCHNNKLKRRGQCYGCQRVYPNCSNVFHPFSIILFYEVTYSNFRFPCQPDEFIDKNCNNSLSNKLSNIQIFVMFRQSIQYVTLIHWIVFIPLFTRGITKQMSVDSAVKVVMTTNWPLGILQGLTPYQ